MKANKVDFQSHLVLNVINQAIEILCVRVCVCQMQLKLIH